MTTHPHAPWCKPDCTIPSGTREEILEKRLEHFMRAFDDCQRHHSTESYAAGICINTRAIGGADHKWEVRRGSMPTKGQKCFCGKEEI